MHRCGLAGPAIWLASLLVVLTGCVSSDTADTNQDHLDAVNAVAERIHRVAGTISPDGGAAAGVTCFGATGEEIERQAAGAGAVVEGDYSSALVDEIIAEFDTPDGTRDEPSTLADRTPTREAGFGVTVDGVAVSVVAWVAETGAFGWVASTSCSN